MVGRILCGTRERHLAWILLGSRDELLIRLVWTVRRHHQRVRCEMVVVHRINILCFVLRTILQRLQHDVRNIDTHDIRTVSGIGVHLTPHQGATGASSVNDDHGLLKVLR